MMITTIPDTYGYVLLVATLKAFELLAVGFIVPGMKRGKVFTKEFMDKNFLEEHKSATGEEEVNKEGFPDMGNGRYSAKLPYKDWYQFGNAQRAHYNFLEMAVPTFLWLLIAGVYFPIPAAALGLGAIIFRLIYVIGYVLYGAKGRAIGAGGNDLMVLALFGLSFASSVRFILGDLP